MSRAGVAATGVLSLALTLPAAAAGTNWMLECEPSVGADIPGAERALRLTAPMDVAVSGRALSESLYALDVAADDLPGIHPAAVACPGVRSVSIVPARLLGTAMSRIVVRHDGPAPVLSGDGATWRLTWQPSGSGSAYVTSAPAPAAGTAMEGARSRAGDVAPASPVSDGAVTIDPPSHVTTVIRSEVRSGPGRRFRAVRDIPASTVLEVTARQGDWLRVRDGWVFAAYCAEGVTTARAGTGMSVVTAVTAPVYSGPGGQFEVVTELYRDQEVVIDDVQGDWAHVRNGGWVRRTLLGPVRAGSSH